MRGWFFGLIVACAAALGTGGATAQQGEQRIALIIANEAYVSPNLGRLPGTQNDAALMQSALRRAGFAVTVQRNLNRTQMRSALSAFRGQLASLGQRGVGFLYYSGHGVADGPRGQNWLVPIDAQINNVTDLPSTSIPLDEELDGIDMAGAKATIIVIDACRNTPVSFRRGSRGLAPVQRRTDTLIAFSTDAGETAADDGAYARALSEELVMPGSDAASVFARVQTNVALRTNRAQRPHYENGLMEPIMFVPQTARRPTDDRADGRTFVPATTIINDAQTTPVMCQGPKLDGSCESSVRLANIVGTTARGTLRTPRTSSGVMAVITAEAQIAGGMLCSRNSTAEVDVIGPGVTPDGRQEMIAMVRERVQQSGDVCTRYTTDGVNYYGQAYNTSGAEIGQPFAVTRMRSDPRLAPRE